MKDARRQKPKRTKVKITNHPEKSVQHFNFYKPSTTVGSRRCYFYARLSEGNLAYHVETRYLRASKPASRISMAECVPDSTVGLPHRPLTMQMRFVNFLSALQQLAGDRTHKFLSPSVTYYADVIGPTML